MGDVESVHIVDSEYVGGMTSSTHANQMKLFSSIATTFALFCSVGLAEMSPAKAQDNSALNAVRFAIQAAASTDQAITTQETFEALHQKAAEAIGKATHKPVSLDIAEVVPVNLDKFASNLTPLEFKGFEDTMLTYAVVPYRNTYQLMNG